MSDVTKLLAGAVALGLVVVIGIKVAGGGSSQSDGFSPAPPPPPPPPSQQNAADPGAEAVRGGFAAAQTLINNFFQNQRATADREAARQERQEDREFRREMVDRDRSGQSSGNRTSTSR